MKLFFKGGNQYVGGHCVPYLRLHRFLARIQKTLDTQMLLGPLKEQFDLPAFLVQSRDGQRVQGGIVGQKHQRFASFRVFESDTTQMLGIFLGRVKTVEPNRLVANHSRTSIGLVRVHPPCVHSALGSSHKIRSHLMQLEEPSEIQIAPIHHVKCSRLDEQDVEYFDIAHLAIADVNKSRYRTTQIQQRVHFYRRFGTSKRRPIEQAQTQVDDSRVQCIHPAP